MGLSSSTVSIPRKSETGPLATAAVQAGAIAADIGCGSGFITEGLIHVGLHVSCRRSVRSDAISNEKEVR